MQSDLTLPVAKTYGHTVRIGNRLKDDTTCPHIRFYPVSVFALGAISSIGYMKYLCRN